MVLAVKILIVVVLLAIVASLFSGLFFLQRDKGADSRRTARALTVRIGLSVALFILLMLLLATGVMEPNESPLMFRDKP